MIFHGLEGYGDSKPLTRKPEEKAQDKTNSKCHMSRAHELGEKSLSFLATGQSVVIFSVCKSEGCLKAPGMGLGT